MHCILSFLNLTILLSATISEYLFRLFISVITIDIDEDSFILIKRYKYRAEIIAEPD
ncbi:hypothetical protein HMPREF0240_03547 [Clostridium sp. D5]|nr:hypothetical protein HMPREF0240_03547 [Clostridium sp. D5]